MSEVKGNHPLAEIIAKKLFGIESDWPAAEKRRMVNRACKAAVEYNQQLEQQLKDEKYRCSLLIKSTEQRDQLAELVDEACTESGNYHYIQDKKQQILKESK